MQAVLPPIGPQVTRKLDTPMDETPKNRTVKPNGEVISRLRKAKGWRVEDLAKKAKCSVRTVENVERGANVYLYTLGKFATTLGVEYAVLVSGGDPPLEPPKPRTGGDPPPKPPTLVPGGDPPPKPPKSQGRLTVQVTVDVPFEEFDESEQLVSFMTRLKQIVQVTGEILVAGVEDGSTIITLEMTIDDIERLIEAFGPALDELRVEKLQLPVDEEFTLTNRGMPMEGVSFGDPLRGRLLTRVVPNIPPELGFSHLLHDDVEAPPVPEHKPADADE